jgi:hypothetical protein
MAFCVVLPLLSLLLLMMRNLEFKVDLVMRVYFILRLILILRVYLISSIYSRDCIPQDNTLFLYSRRLLEIA